MRSPNPCQQLTFRVRSRHCLLCRRAPGCRQRAWGHRAGAAALQVHGELQGVATQDALLLPHAAQFLAPCYVCGTAGRTRVNMNVRAGSNGVRHSGEKATQLHSSVSGAFLQQCQPPPPSPRSPASTSARMAGSFQGPTSSIKLPLLLPAQAAERDGMTTRTSRAANQHDADGGTAGRGCAGQLPASRQSAQGGPPPLPLTPQVVWYAVSVNVLEQHLHVVIGGHLRGENKRGGAPRIGSARGAGAH